MQRPLRTLGMTAAGVLVTVALAAVVVISLVRAKDTATVGPDGGTLRSRDGQTAVAVPPGGATLGTVVDFVPQPRTAHDLNSMDNGIISIGPPIDIRVKKGTLAKGVVTLRYDPKRLPRGAAPANVGIMMFDGALGIWLPLMDAKADPTSSSVSGTAPHFSIFSVVSLDPLRKAVDIAGRQIDVAVDKAMTVPKFIANMVAGVARKVTQSLFAIPDKLECDEPSRTVTSETKSGIGGAFNACVQSEGKGDELRLQNKYGFPVRLHIPRGLNVGLDNLLESNGDLFGLVRNVAWMARDQVVVAGAEISHVDVTPEMNSSALLAGEMDLAAVVLDVGLAGLLVLAPQRKVVELEIHASLRVAITAANESNGSLTVGAAVTAELRKSVTLPGNALMGKVFDLGDCAISSTRAVALGSSLKDLLGRAADIAHGCLGRLMQLKKLNIDDLFSGIVNSLKVIPEVLQGSAAASLKNLTLGKVDVGEVSVRVGRINTPQLLKPYIYNWHNHSAGLDIGPEGEGTFYWQPLDASCHPTVACWQSARVEFVVAPWGATGRLVSSTRPVDYRVGTKFALHRMSGDRLEALGWILCGPDAQPGACGA